MPLVPASQRDGSTVLLICLFGRAANGYLLDKGRATGDRADTLPKCREALLALMKPGNLLKRPAGIGLAAAVAAGLVSCSDPDPKSECARYRVEMEELDGRWSAHPPVGMSYSEEIEYRFKYEQKNPNYVADRNKIDREYERRLRTSSVARFCRSFS